MLAVENLRVEKFCRQRDKITAELLTALRANDYNTAAQLLEKVVQGGITSPVLWHCRTFFRELPEYIIKQSPTLMAGFVMLNCLKYSPAQAAFWLEKLSAFPPQNATEHAQVKNLLAYLALQMPIANGGKLLPLLRRTAESVQRGEIHPIPCTLTANRPSVFNGMFDLSRHQKCFHRMREPLETLFSTVYGSSAHLAVDMIQAEIFYQQNKQGAALSLASSAINILCRTESSPDILFTAMSIVIQIQLSTGQNKASEAAVRNAQDMIVKLGAFHLLPSVKAMHVRVDLCLEDYDRVKNWIAHEAPDENGDYQKLDNFAYFIKIRAYLALCQPMLALGLCERLRPMLHEHNHPMQKCELDLLLSITYSYMGECEQAMGYLESALHLAEKYCYYRLFADEGSGLYSLLQRYTRSKKPAKKPFLSTVIRLTHEMAVLYPNYLKTHKSTPHKLTPKQLEALRFAASHHTNVQIAARMDVSKNAVTGYFRRIFATLEVSSRHQAVEVARNLGLLD